MFDGDGYLERRALLISDRLVFHADKLAEVENCWFFGQPGQNKGTFLGGGFSVFCLLSIYIIVNPFRVME